MLGTEQVLIDADALVGLINQNDALHSRCLQVVEFLSKNSLATTVLPPTILEAATALSRGIKLPDLAKQLLADYSQLKPAVLPSEIFSNLIGVYNPTVTTKNTPFDYFLLAYAKIKQIDIIFSFDRFYERQGLTLAEKLLKR